MVTYTNKTFELDFLNFINAFIKSRVGKGPKETQIRVAGDTIIYYIRGIFTEREVMLLNDDYGRKLVLESRRLFVELDRKNRHRQFEEFLECKVLETYESWNLDNDSAVGVILLERELF